VGGRLSSVAHKAACTENHIRVYQVAESVKFGAMVALIRRERLDHVVVLGQAHLCRILKSYADYYYSNYLRGRGD
jgi:hypothetical protein